MSEQEQRTAKLEAAKILVHRGTCWDLWPRVLKGPVDEPDFYEEIEPCDLCKEYIHALREKRGLPKTEAPW